MSGTAYAPSQAIIDGWNMIRDDIPGKRWAMSTLAGQIWTSMFVGDSRIEGAQGVIPTLGDMPNFCAGIPGGTIRDGAQYIPAMVQACGPRVAVVQIGINQCWVPVGDPTWNTIVADYTAMLRGIKAYCPVIATTAIPEEKGFSDPDASVSQRCNWLMGINAQIQQACSALNVQCIDLHALFAGPDLTAIKGTTWDGRHFPAPTLATIAEAIGAPAVALWP